MLSIEDKIKSEILAQYKSVRAFTQTIGIPYSTIDSMLKKGVSGTAVQTIIKVCDSLNMDLNSIAREILGTPDASPISTCTTKEAAEVAEAYDKADIKSKNIARQALDLPPLSPTSNTPHIPDMARIMETAETFAEQTRKKLSRPVEK